MRRPRLYGFEYMAPAEEEGAFGAGIDLDDEQSAATEQRAKTFAEDLAAGLESDTDAGERDPDDLEPEATEDDESPVSFADLLAEQGLNVDGDDDIAKFAAIAERAKRAEQLEQQLAQMQSQQQQLPANMPHVPVQQPLNQQQMMQQLPPALRDYVERAQGYDQIYQSILNAPKRLDYWNYVKQTEDGYAPTDPSDSNAVVDAQLAARWVQQNIPQVIANLPGLIEHTIARKIVEGQGVLPQLLREVATQSVVPAVQPIQQRIQQQEEAVKRAAKADELWESVREKAQTTTADGQVIDTPYGAAFRAMATSLMEDGMNDPEKVFAKAKAFADKVGVSAPEPKAAAKPAQTKAGRQIEMLRKQAAKTPSKGSAVKNPPKAHTPKRRGEAGKEHALLRDMQKGLEQQSA